MPHDAATLMLVEDALSECFNYHASLDAFLQRSGVESQLLADARARAEARAVGGSRFSKAPKRFVTQEVLTGIADLGTKGDTIIAAIITALIRGTFPQATANAVA